MKVRAGILTDEQRSLIFNANASGSYVLVAAKQALVLDNLGPSGERGPGQYVGVPQTWDYETLTIGSPWSSFTVAIEWEQIRGVWLRDDAPDADVVQREFLDA